MVRHVLSSAMEGIYDLTRVIEGTNTALAIFDIQGNCLYGNAEFKTFFGCKDGQPVDCFQRLISSPQILHTIDQSLKSAQPWEGTAWVRCSSSQESLVLLSAIPMNDPCSQFFTVFMPMKKITSDEKTWQALQESEDQYRRLVTLTPNLMLVEMDDEIVFINPGGLKILGAAREEEIIGKSIADFIQLDGRDILCSYIRNPKPPQDSTRPVMGRWQRLDGTPFDMEVVAVPLTFKGKAAVQLIGNDVTERKRSHEQLGLYTRQLLALNTIGMAAVSSRNTNVILEKVTHSLGAVLQASSLSVALRGTRELTVVASSGSSASAYLGRRYPLELLDTFRSISNGESIHLYGSEIKDIKSFFPELTAPAEHLFLIVPLKQGTDIIGLLVAIYVDGLRFSSVERELCESTASWITLALQNARMFQNEQSQLHYAEALLESAFALNSNLELPEVLDRILQQLWRVLPCSAANIMIIEDENVRIVSWIGYESRPGFVEMVKNFKKPLKDFYYMDQLTTTHQALIIADTHSVSNWTEISGNDWIRSYAVAPLVIGGNVFGYINMDSDQPGYFDEEMVQRLQAFAAQASIALQNAHLVKTLQNSLHQEQTMRAQLVQSEKLAAMGRMVATVAHELNNPLQTIQNCLFILEQEGNVSDELQDYVQTGLSEIRRLSDMVSVLRGAYRPAGENSVAAIDPEELLEQVHHLLKIQLQSKKVSWEVSSSAPGARVQVTADQLKQVFLNLGQNAIEAMEPAGGSLRVDIAREQPGKRIQIRFTDTGKGIPAGNLPYIFDPYFTTRQMGFGLGLALCKDIIENHGGSIDVSSQPGAGSTFIIWLPEATEG